MDFPSRPPAAAASGKSKAVTEVLLVGTLSYINKGFVGRHVIRGNWTEEQKAAALHGTTADNRLTMSGRFELSRNIPPQEDVTQLPMNGEFDGWFSLQECNCLLPLVYKIAESGVALSFKEDKEREGEYSVKGKGTNKFGGFTLFGTATKVATTTGEEDGKEYKIEVRKRYNISPPALEEKKKKKRRNLGDSVKLKKKAEVTNSTLNSKRSPPLPTVTPELKKPAAGVSRKRKSLHPTVSKSDLQFAPIPVGNGLTKKEIPRLSNQEGKPSVVDVCYYSPAKKYKFQSEAEIKLFMECLAETTDGDETVAIVEYLKRKAEMKQEKESNQPTKRKTSEAPEAKAPYSRQSSVESHPYFVYDAKLAAHLGREEARLAEEERKMLSTNAGRAYKFVEKVLTECHSLKTEQGDEGISAIAQDDMVFMTENMLICQETFQEANKTATVDIGFHFTSESVLTHIQRDGLMTMEDRESNPKLNAQEAGRKHGMVFGDGVYTGNAPADLTKYGDVGMLVVRLQGKTKRIDPNDVELVGTLHNPGVRVKRSVGVGQKAMREGYDTVIGNKMWSRIPNRERYDEIVLLRSSQVVPVLKFNAKLVQDKSTTIPSALVPWLNAMKKIVDDFFNKPETVLGSSVDDVGAPSTSAAENPPLPHSAVARKPPPNLQAPSLPPVASTKQQAQKPPPISGTQAKVNSGWQNGDRDVQERKKIVHAIVQRFRLRNPNIAPQELKSFANKFESLLYKSAPSFEAYKDASTLTQRLEQFFRRISAKNSQSSSQAVPSSLRRSSSTASVLEDVIQYNAPDTLPSSDTNMFETPKICICISSDNCICGGTFKSSDPCVSCLDELGPDVTKLSKCKTCNFNAHKDCLLPWLRQNRTCPTCRIGIREPIGKSPSGQMRVSTNRNMSCEGFSNVGTIVIDYIMSSGRQKEYHDEEGKAFERANRRAFMPDNDEGRDLLKRLKWAFSHGLTFRIGTSLTTNRKGVITWASIHHKTSTTKGAYGWPDATYFLRRNKELDNLGVPKAGDCS